MADQKDKVYAAPMSTIEAFRFDAAVADVFQDMIERSVPGYGLILQLIGSLAERYGRSQTNVYDLGCSLGASTLQLRKHVPPNCQVIGVDSSEAMVERCRATLSRDHSAAPFDIRLEDLRNTVIENASIVVLNFTLQFVPDQERLAILKRIAEGIVPGGILLLAEKVRFDGESEQSLMADLHHDFKKYQGYSDLEVAQKRTALENVLVPNSEQQHISRLAEAGFSTQVQCVRCLNFETFLAIR
ncbi:MAG: carboxy-S-adenosyl-L-methionine synthase CmoA [Gammaproteobacteria bacterium]|jgi:tRNA (cmo5U34)-methyltransferase|nr:carboxy-S-adenosyl-L-methionine synthase CmoA [Gammaproteobacteria bacterium]MBT4493562.1 carboxy-S-adenosyl-L-methionine synthase CmoA [Gammaproteobacteria bacterium]MBT7371652.1 carboxy-S-adenosyl-L-methionine synthase CmoA [Gammaproteobacteria bacterium]